MKWVITDEPRKVNQMITFDGSPIMSDGEYVPITLQSINAIEIRTALTIKLDNGNIIN